MAFRDEHSTDLSKRTAWILLVVILLTGWFMRQYRVLDFPLHGDEVDEGDIALEILHGNFALFYPQNEGNEPLYQAVMAPFFAVLGDSTVANRFPSTMWSTVFIALMYTFGRVLFRSRRVGVMAAGLTAVLWWPTIFGRLGLREISQAVMMTPALIGLVLAYRDPSDERANRFAIIGGIFAGLVSYTFLSGRGFPVVVVLFLIYLAIAQRDQFRKRWRPLGIYLALTIAITIPLLAYLQMHPELDFHTQDLATRNWLAQGSVDAMVRNLQATFGMFTIAGDINWVRNIPGRPVFPGVEGWLFYLGVALCVWNWRKPEYVLPLIVVATFLMPNILTEDPPRWTRSIGILPGLMLIPVLPLQAAWSQIEKWLSAKNAQLRWRASFASAILVGLLGISIFARTATDMFQVWLDSPGIYWMTLAFYDGVGRYVNSSPETTPLNYVMDFYTSWREHNIQRTIQRPNVATRYSVLSAFVFPDDARGNRIAFQIFAAPPTALLEAFLDLDHPIAIDARVDPQGQRPLHVYDVPRAKLDEHLARAKANQVFSPDTNMLITTPIQVGDALQFIGYKVVNPDTRLGTDLNVLTYWRVLRRPPSMAAFVHLVDSQQRVVAQFDGFEAVVDRLAPGDVVVQLHTLSLPSDLPTGTYRFELGAYARDDLQRMPLSTGTDRVLLQTWQVK
ncbi:MAG: glycosyltransferase family 39 protein [Chloroflexi bacterium]|nr:glycosyltransferase family 39 protein [Chloroflexota bacterium]